MQKIQYLDCYAAWDGKQLCLGNQNIERTYPVCEGRLSVGELRAADGYIWGNYESKQLMLIGRTEEMTVLMEQDDRNGMSDPHIKVTLRFTCDAYDFDRVLRIFPVHPFISTEYTVRRYDGSAKALQAEDAENTALEKNKLNAGVQLCRPDAVEALPIPSRHIKVEEITLRDRTDVNDWLVKRSEDAIYARGNYRGKGNLFAVRDYLEGKTLLIVRESPVVFGMLNPADCDLCQSGTFLQVCGTGFSADAITEPMTGYGCTIGLADDAQVWALYQAYHRAQAAANRKHAGCIMSNTWGDRSRDAAVCHDFILRELDTAKELGLDVLQIDDGWAKGLTANSAFANNGVWGRYYDLDPEFWTVNPDRFPHGLEPIVQRAEEYGISLGLWFSPDATDDYKYWRRDADTLLALHKRYGIRWFKLDGICIENKTAETNYLRFLNAVRDESGEKISFNQDITAQTRLGYLYESKYFGTLFVENRYTDWGNYYPHATLKNLWHLSSIFPPERFQFEVLNKCRNEQNYKNDPLAPANYDIDYLFASVMPASPLIWMELTGLPREDVKRLSRIIGIYKEHRGAFAQSRTIPIGKAPDGTQFTGFQIRRDERSGYLILLREYCSGDIGTYTLDCLPDCELTLTALCTNYDAPAVQKLTVSPDNRFQAAIGKRFGYLFAKYECSK